MKLTIDLGNTQSKLGVFDGNNLLFVITLKRISKSVINQVFYKYPIQSSILSSVIKNPVWLVKHLKKKSEFIVLTHKTPIPIKNDYRTPNTLGKDRLASVVAASARFPQKNILVIDAGSCITYDFINESNTFMGGSISPGINMRFKALRNYTMKLPFLQKQPLSELTGNSTRNAIISGVQNGVLMEAEGIIAYYKRSFSDVQLVICGGDYEYFEKNLKCSTFVIPNLVLEGLNEILEYNITHKK